MPTKRRRVTRAPGQKITPEAVAAHKANHWVALHRALRLPPWDMSAMIAVHGPLDHDNDDARSRGADLRAALKGAA